jgi:hypothetical protein
MRKLHAMALCLLFCVAFAGTVLADPIKQSRRSDLVAPMKRLTQAGDVTGTVVSCTDHTPVGGALVYVPGRSFLAVTDDEGRFVLHNVFSGTYSLVVQIGGQTAAAVEGVMVRPRRATDAGTVCVCPAGFTPCDGQCVDLLTDSTHCGSCGNACDTGEVCLDGSCRVSGEGDEGCTPGYWKNHLDSWHETGYLSGRVTSSVFVEASAYPPLGNASLLQTLDFAGGPGVQGAAEILLRAGVAALLNAAHPGVDYFRTAANVIASVDAALASGNRDTILSLAVALDADNNRGCPLP